MDVSTFELLYKPLTPSFGNAQVGTLARRVVQGYFLTVANLAERDYRYRLQFQISVPTNNDPNRLMENNTVLLADVAGANTTLTLSRNGNRYASSLFTVPARQTALVAVLPNFVGSLGNTNPQIEIRGFVSLTIPALRRPDSFFFFNAQSDPDVPVNVMLNPETRSTFLPNNFPASLNDLDFDQANHSLPIASGRAVNGINPDPNFSLLQQFPLTFERARGFQLERLAAAADERVLRADSEERIATLVALLGQVGENKDQVAMLSELLDEAQIPIKLDSTRAQPLTAMADGNGHTDL